MALQINDGTYLARASEWCVRKVGNNGTPAVTVRFRLLELDGQPAVSWDGWLTEKTLERTIESLRHCGWTGTRIDDLQGLDAQDVQLVVENEEYNGNWYPKVKWVNGLGGGMRSEGALEGSELSGFARELENRILALGGNQRQAARPAPQRQTAQSTAQRAPSGQQRRQQSSAGPRSPEPPPLDDPFPPSRQPGDDDIPF